MKNFTSTFLFEFLIIQVRIRKKFMVFSEIKLSQGHLEGYYKGLYNWLNLYGL